MKNQPAYYSGRALVLSAVLMTVTMIMHPAGGTFEHLQHIAAMIIITHSLAILSVPIALFGFWGLTKKLSVDDPLSVGAFITVCIGMFAVLMAAAFNGLALPLFIEQFHDPSAGIRNSLTLLLSYNNALNHSFDYIFIAGIVIAVTLWSVVIIKTKAFPVWVGYFGIFTCVMVVIGMTAGFIFVNLTGFRVFTAGLVVWMIIIGIMLKKQVPAVPEI
ncbi:MAG TPA: hypothetical protein VIM55_17960 [Mucilaginibacter sp.]